MVAALVAMILVLGLGAADLAKALVAVSTAQSAARTGAELIECRCAPGTLEATVRVRVPVGYLSTLGGERIVEARARAIVDPGS